MPKVSFEAYRAIIESYRTPKPEPCDPPAQEGHLPIERRDMAGTGREHS